MKHANIAIFVPHNGCPHQCSFCDQKKITGTSYQPQKNDVIHACEIAMRSLKDSKCESEIAFFGGSFTAIDKNYMLELLDAAYGYVKDGTFSGIRISTRPDAISEEILKLLKERGVTSIELGCQSMDDKVLALNDRGHTKDDVIYASNLIKQYGFSLGLQMMVGLYGSTIEKDLKTAQEIVKLKPDTARIYPTVIMKNTKLADLYNNGVYVPFTFNETVDVCSKILSLFKNNSIRVIRLGLHDTDSLHSSIVAGVWHPAFREICESKILFEKSLKVIESIKDNKNNIIIYVNSKTVSKMVGNKKSNIIKFKEKGYNVKIKVDDEILEDDFKINVI